MQFSEILKELRTEKGLNQSKLAEILGLTQDSISLWENGKRLPDTQYLVLLADFFNVTTDYLLGRADDFGNVGAMPSAAPALSPEERELLGLFRELGGEYKQLAIDTIRTWTGKTTQKERTKRA